MASLARPAAHRRVLQPHSFQRLQISLLFQAGTRREDAVEERQELERGWRDGVGRKGGRERRIEKEVEGEGEIEDGVVNGGDRRGES